MLETPARRETESPIAARFCRQDLEAALVDLIAASGPRPRGRSWRRDRALINPRRGAGPAGRNGSQSGIRPKITLALERRELLIFSFYL
jgi:hypothetical protein